MRSAKLQNRAFVVLIVLVAAIFLGGIGWFVNQLLLRGGWHEAKQALTQRFAQAYQDGAVIERGGEQLQADRRTLDLYYDFFINPNTMVMKKKTLDTTAQTLYLHLPDTTVSFTPIDDGYYTCVQWELDGKSYGYALRGHVAFEHLDRFFVEARYRAQQAEPETGK